MSHDRALVYGFWGQNIGNAFFNVGGAGILRDAFGCPPSLIQDQPAYWTFHDEAKGGYPRAFPMIGEVDVRTIVLQGPILNRNFGNVWQDTFARRAAAGDRWAGIGIGLRKYDSEEMSQVADVLRAFPPVFISTRDVPTFEFLRSLDLPGTALRSGIDSAFFTPFAYEPPPIRAGGPGLALCFDHYPEPTLVPDPGGAICVNGRTYRPTLSGWRQRAAGYGKASAIAAQALAARGEATLDGVRIVRPRHRTNPHLPSVLYRVTNALASDEPYTYLTIYASVDLTLSDRVHACVATMAYGNQAMLFNDSTRRDVLFASVGADQIRERPCVVSRHLIDDQRGELISFLQANG